ncbi:MAG: hypothetical protein K9M08_10495 [Pirellula sp.]|nr:hypothetical protein [Pirellula sp.]
MVYKLGAMLAFALSAICALTLRGDEPKTTVANLTFAEPIAAIVYDHCSSCHRPGQSGPFSLLTYSDVSQRAETIQAVIRDGYMPPWKAVHTGIDFSNDRRLSEKTKKQLTEWIDAKCPEGDPTKAPTPPKFPDGWSLGVPDIVVRMDRPFNIPADGPDVYRSFVFPINLPEDKWVKAIELRPTARGAVHHALFFLDIDGAAREQKSLDGQPGFAGMNFLKSRGNSLERMPESLSRGLGGYVPGATPNRLPGDLARYLPKGSDIVMQTHFHPSGKPEVEQAELGIYFADRAPKQKLVAVQMPPVFGMGAGLDIPAGKSDFVMHDEYVLPIDILGFEIGGHAHYICREMTMTATQPDGKATELLRINDWDLDWQDQYLYKNPVALPKGTKLTVDITYDNSAMNPENPFSPPRDISWGRESTDEMGSITMLVLAAAENERPVLELALQDRMRDAFGNRIRSQMGRIGGLLGGGNGLDGAFVKLLDRNRDGRLQKSEIPAKFRDRLLDLMDSNNDEQIDKSEMESSRKEMERILDRRPKGN